MLNLVYQKQSKQRFYKQIILELSNKLQDFLEEKSYKYSTDSSFVQRK